MKDILFLMGGGGADDYAADARMVASLQTSLSEKWHVHYPFLVNTDEPDFGRMRQISTALHQFPAGVIVVAHSLGASILLKYLSENASPVKIKGAFLIATPFWEGDEDWKQEFKLKEHFEKNIPVDIPLFFYQCRDDEVVPVEQLEKYTARLPGARSQILPEGGHHFNNDLTLIANDINSLQGS